MGCALRFSFNAVRFELLLLLWWSVSLLDTLHMIHVMRADKLGGFSEGCQRQRPSARLNARVCFIVLLCLAGRMWDAPRGFRFLSSLIPMMFVHLCILSLLIPMTSLCVVCISCIISYLLANLVVL